MSSILPIISVTFLNFIIFSDVQVLQKVQDSNMTKREAFFERHPKGIKPTAENREDFNRLKRNIERSYNAYTKWYSAKPQQKAYRRCDECRKVMFESWTFCKTWTSEKIIKFKKVTEIIGKMLDIAIHRQMRDGGYGKMDQWVANNQSIVNTLKVTLCLISVKYLRLIYSILHL
jgi:hypothetical protein